MNIIFLGKAMRPERVQALRRRAGRFPAIHMHGWKAASLAWLLRMFFPETPIVWTIEALPPRWIMWQAAWAGVAMVATTRETQWRVLDAVGVRVRYIPDGYEPPALPPISVRRFGLWPGRYVAAAAQTLDEIDWVKRAYAKVKTKKKLVIVQEKSGGRAEQSLYTGAAAIILASRDIAPATIFSAMESGRPIIAVAAPLLEEILGVTAQFVPAGAEAELAAALKNSKTSTKAQKRARAHFTWERIFAEYAPLYQKAVFTVPLDSARGILKTAPGW